MSMHVTRIPVLIVGAGVGGLATSALLAQHGIRSLLVEKRREVFIYPKARNLSFRSLEILRGLGLSDDVHAVAGGVSDMVVKPTLNSAEEAPAIDVDAIFAPFSELSPEPPAQYCPQSKLEPMLLADTRRRGSEVRYGTELSSFEQDDAGVTVVVRERDSGETETVRADYLVAADGVHSPIRDALGITTSGYGALPIFVVFVYFKAPWRKFVPHLADGDGVQVKNADVDGIFLVVEGDLGMFITTYLPGKGETAAQFTPQRCARVAHQGHRRADRHRHHRGGSVATVRAGGRPIPVRASLSRRRRGAHHAAVQGGWSQHRHPERAQPGLEARCRFERPGRARIAEHLSRRAASGRAIRRTPVTHRTDACAPPAGRRPTAIAAGRRGARCSLCWSATNTARRQSFPTNPRPRIRTPCRWWRSCAVSPAPGCRTCGCVTGSRRSTCSVPGSPCLPGTSDGVSAVTSASAALDIPITMHCIGDDAWATATGLSRRGSAARPPGRLRRLANRPTARRPGSRTPPGTFADPVPLSRRKSTATRRACGCCCVWLALITAGCSCGGRGVPAPEPAPR